MAESFFYFSFYLNIYMILKCKEKYFETQEENVVESIFLRIQNNNDKT